MTKLSSATVMFCGLVIASGALGAGVPSFDEVDINHDGVISKAEAAEAKSLDFEKADTNEDGEVSRSEYEAATR